MANRVDIVIAGKDQASAALTQVAGKFAALAGSVLSVNKVLSTFNEVIKEIQRIGSSAATFGITIEKMAQLADAAEAAGVSFEELHSGLKFFSKAMVDAQTPGNAMSQLFNQMGVNSKDLFTALLQTGDAFGRYANDQNKSALAMQLFGRGGDETIEFLNEMRRYMGMFGGGPITSEAYDRIRTYKEEISKLHNVWGDFTKELSLQVLPTLTDLAKSLNEVLSGTNNLTKSSSEMVRTLNFLKKEAGWVKTWFEAVGYFGTMHGAAFQAFTEGKYDEMRELLRMYKEGEPYWGNNLTPGRNAVNSQNNNAKEKAPSTDSAKAALELELAEALKAKAIEQAIFDERESLLKKYYATRLITAQQYYHEMEILTGERMSAEVRGLENEVKEKSVAEQAEAEAKITGIKQEAIAKRMELETEASKYSNNLMVQMKLQLGELMDSWGTLAYQAATTIRTTIGDAVTGVSQAIAQAAVVTGNWGKAFAQLGIQMLTNFVAAVAQMVLIALVAKPILLALGVLSGGSIPATGAVVTMEALGSVGAYAEGGVIPGPVSTRDNVYIHARSGEGILTPEALARLGGEQWLNQVNNLRVPVREYNAPHFAEGGLVGGGMANGIGQMANGQAPVNVYYVHSEEELARAMESRPGRNAIIRAVQRGKMDIGLRT